MKRFYLFLLSLLTLAMAGCGHDEPIELRIQVDVVTTDSGSELVRQLQLGYTANIGALHDGYQRISDFELSIIGEGEDFVCQTYDDVEVGSENARKAAEAALFSFGGKPVRLVSVDSLDGLENAESVEVVCRVGGVPKVLHFFRIVED